MLRIRENEPNFSKVRQISSIFWKCGKRCHCTLAMLASLVVKDSSSIDTNFEDSFLPIESAPSGPDVCSISVGPPVVRSGVPGGENSDSWPLAGVSGCLGSDSWSALPVLPLKNEENDSDNDERFIFCCFLVKKLFYFLVFGFFLAL